MKINIYIYYVGTYNKISNCFALRVRYFKEKKWKESRPMWFSMDSKSLSIFKQKSSATKFFVEPSRSILLQGNL